MIDQLPAAPDPANDIPAVFNQKAAALVLAQKAMVPQINAALSSLGSIAFGGAYAIPYIVDLTSTADADPTAGLMRFNAATQNAATAIYLDLLGSDQIDYTTILDQFDASTSTVKGQLRIVKQGDVSKFLTFNVTARTTASGYRKLTLANTGGSAASPFVQGDGVLLKFTATGDKGDPGNTGFAKFSDQKSAGVNGGASVAASGSYNVRTLNTTEANTFGATLTANMFTLPPGKYVIQARVPAYAVGTHRAALYNVSDASYTAFGSSELDGSGSGCQTDSKITAYISISTSKSYRIYHATEVAATAGLGYPTNVGGGVSMGGPEVYTEVSVWKLS